MRVLCRVRANEVPRLVRRAIIDKDDLIIIAAAVAANLSQTLMQNGDILSLVVTWRHDGDQWPSRLGYVITAVHCHFACP
jgi:hypothetical protein